MSAMKFKAELADFKIMCNVLRAITFKEFAVIHPMEEGLKVTVEEMRCVETSAYFPANLFSSYYIDSSEDIKFKISLKILTECLHIFGEDYSPSLKLSYKSIGSPLHLVLKHPEENISVDCEIQTMNTDEFPELNLLDGCDENKVVLNADIFTQLLNDLDATTDDFQILLSPDPPYFKITAKSSMGESVINISNNSEMVLLFQCSKTTCSSYVFSNIKQILKVMNLANKVSISTGNSGLLGFQFVINANDKQMYVEYYVNAVFNPE